MELPATQIFCLTEPTPRSARPSLTSRRIARRGLRPLLAITAHPLDPLKAANPFPFLFFETVNDFAFLLTNQTRTEHPLLDGDAGRPAGKRPARDAETDRPDIERDAIVRFVSPMLLELKSGRQRLRLRHFLERVERCCAHLELRPVEQGPANSSDDRLRGERRLLLADRIVRGRPI